MPLINKNLNQFKWENKQVVLSNSYLSSNSYSFKKITGSRFSSILGFSKYNSPFKTWMIMTNLYKDVMDPVLANVGNVVEPIIRKHVINELGINFKVYNPFDCGWDVFKENKIFGGIPDGEPLNGKNVIDYSNDAPMLEIKTTSIDSFVYKTTNNELKMMKDSNGAPLVKEVNGKRRTWFDMDNKIKLPSDYQLQLGLYMYLRKAHKGLFAVGFLKVEDYVSPEKFDFKNREIRLIDFSFDHQEFKKYIDYGENWYKQHILTGKSPIMTDEDVKWLQTEMSLTK